MNTGTILKKHKYDTDISVTTSLSRTQIFDYGDIVHGKIEKIEFRFKEISSMTALSKITVSAEDRDSAYILPSTSGSIEIDAATATLGSLVLGVEFGEFQLDDDENIFLGVQGDAGTAKIDEVTFFVRQ